MHSNVGKGLQEQQLFMTTQAMPLLSFGSSCFHEKCVVQQFRILFKKKLWPTFDPPELFFRSGDVTTDHGQNLVIPPSRDPVQRQVDHCRFSQVNNGFFRDSAIPPPCLACLYQEIRQIRRVSSSLDRFSSAFSFVVMSQLICSASWPFGNILVQLSSRVPR